MAACNGWHKAFVLTRKRAHFHLVQPSLATVGVHSLPQRDALPPFGESCVFQGVKPERGKHERNDCLQ